MVEIVGRGGFSADVVVLGGSGVIQSGDASASTRMSARKRGALRCIYIMRGKGGCRGYKGDRAATECAAQR